MQQPAGALSSRRNTRATPICWHWPRHCAKAEIMASNPGSRTFGTMIAAVLIAFVAGLGVMAIVIPRWQAWRGQPAVTAPAAQPATPAAAAVQPLAPLVTTPTEGQTQAIDTRVADIESRMARVDLRAA